MIVIIYFVASVHSIQFFIILLMAQRRTTNRQDTNVEKICTYASERRKRTLNSFAFSLSKLKQLLFSLNISVSTSGQQIYRQIFKCTQTIQNQKNIGEDWAMCNQVLLRRNVMLTIPLVCYVQSNCKILGKYLYCPSKFLSTSQRNK